jgi:glutamate/aspartate transport system permease protein
MSEFDIGVILRALPFLWQGMQLTLLLTVLAMMGGILLGTGLALLRMWAPTPFPQLAAGYVNLLRSIPLILVVFWFYFLVPLAIGRPIGSLTSALIAFVMFEAAFYCEIIRAGISNVRQGQTEAGLATGLRRFQVMRHIVMPQALRAMTPLVLNQIVIVFQDTSLVYVVALHDFLTTASIVAARDGRPTEMYTLVAVVYLIICLSSTKALDYYRKGRAA